MIKYLALLRAVNVGGHNIIKMDDLKNLFISLGYKNVETLIQSGNVIFETSEKNIKAVIKKIEANLNDLMKKDIKVFVRTISELEEIVEKNPFSKTNASNKIKTYVFFLYEEPKNKVKIPFYSPTKDVTVFKKTGLQLFILVKKIPGKASSPNDLVEKTFGVSTTARNWGTVCKIVEKSFPGI